MKYSFAFAALAAIASAQDFTSVFNIIATPDQVVSATNGSSARGEPGSRGIFKFSLNSRTDTICYDITLLGVTGDYKSPARTATHIHEGPRGQNGPPRIVFPDPVAVDGMNGTRRSVGCMSGPFTTGIEVPASRLMARQNDTAPMLVARQNGTSPMLMARQNGTAPMLMRRQNDTRTLLDMLFEKRQTMDTGAGFTVAQLEANPAGFYVDAHTVNYPAGVVRGQLDQDFNLIEDGSQITTATLTKTELVTISSCAPEVTDCPFKHHPVVTASCIVYTTVCPISDLPYYTQPFGGHSAVPGHPIYTNPSGVVYTQPPSVPVTMQSETKPFHMPAGPTSVYGGPSATHPAQYTGAAAANQVAGALVALAGFAVVAL